MRHLLQELNEHYQITILISSHILGELSKVATRYGVMNQGVLVDEFTQRELETRCRQYLKIRLDQLPKATVFIENKLKTSNYNVVDEETIHLYDYLEQSGLVCLALAEEGINVRTIESKGEDLESYFLHLMGGQGHE